jgi:hypothetical protein
VRTRRFTPPSDTTVNRSLYRQIRERQISEIQTGGREIGNRAWSYSTSQYESTIRQGCTFHSLCLTHVKFIPIQLIFAVHLRSMRLCLENRLAKVFLWYFCNISYLVVNGKSVGSQLERGLDSPEDITGEGASTRCRSQLYSAVGITFYQTVQNANPICNQQLENTSVRTEESPRYCKGLRLYTDS